MNYCILNEKKGLKIMKKLLFAASIVSAMLLAAHSEAAPIDIRVNEEYIKTHSEPVIRGGVTYAPVRSVADALCAETTWDDEEKAASVVLSDSEIKISTLGGEIKKDNVTVSEKSGAFIKDDRAFIPVRLICELFGAEVGWDGLYKNVEIKIGHDVNESAIDKTFTHDELYWLSRIINAESGGEKYEGQVAVGDVILNRVKSKEFPNTIYGVIFDRKYSVQFEPVANGTIYNEPTPKAVEAAKDSLANQSIIGNCLYFFNPKTASSSWISKNRKYYKTIGGHDFYL